MVGAALIGGERRARGLCWDKSGDASTSSSSGCTALVAAVGLLEIWDALYLLPEA